MRITYVTQDTELWGGIGVVFQHLELLAEAGHDAFLTTPAGKPDWYPLHVPLRRIERLDASLIPAADIVVATSWRTIKPVVQSGKGIAVHLCQGYEGDYREFFSLKSDIDEAYSSKIPKLTVSRHLDKLLAERFKAETYFIGQMLDNDIFYPAENKDENKSDASRIWERTAHTLGSVFNKSRQHVEPFKILVVGPFGVSFKNIDVALKGISLARKKMKLPVKLIRVSQFPLTIEEKKVIQPDSYYVHVPHQSMGEIYRDVDLFISTSREEEGFGLPALEAMGCGIPAILSNISSYTSFGDRLEHALFIDPEDPEALAEAIARLFHDRALRERLIRRGLDVAGNFARERFSNRLEAALEQIFNRHTHQEAGLP